ncbi:MAG: HEAT repeat domain-containing protein [Planctomycetota bacterium]
MARRIVYYLCIAVVVTVATFRPAAVFAGEPAPEGPAELYSKLTDPTKNEVNKSFAASKLIDLKTPEADKAIRDALNFDNTGTVCVMVAAIRNKAAVRFIDDVLKVVLPREDEKVRLQMVEALASFMDDNASRAELEDSLKTIIGDDNQPVVKRANAVAVFGALLDYKKGVAFILANVKDGSDARILAAAGAALEKLTWVEDVKTLTDWRVWWKENSAFSRDRWLADYCRRIKKRYEDEQKRRVDQQIEKWDVWALDPAKRNELIKELKEALKDTLEPERLRTAAAIRLGKHAVGDQITAKLILSVMDEPELGSDLLSALVFALGNLGVAKINGDEKVVLERLKKLYEESATPRKVRVEVITALAKIAKEAGTTPIGIETAGYILGLLRDEKTEKAGLLKEAIIAVGEVGDARAAGSLSSIVLDTDNSNARILKPDMPKEIRIEVAKALGKLDFGDDDVSSREEAIRCLLVLLRDREEGEVRKLAANSLAARGVGNDDVIDGLIEAVKAETAPNIRPALTGALSRADRSGKGIEAILDALEKATGDDEAKFYIVSLQQAVNPVLKDESFHYVNCLNIVKLMRKKGLGRHLPRFIADLRELETAAKDKEEEARLECKYELGQYLLGAGDFREALAQFGELVKLVPGKIEYNIALADAHFGSKDYASAFAAYRDALKKPSLSTEQTDNCWNRIIACLEAIMTAGNDPVGVKTRIEELLKKDAEPKVSPATKLKLQELLKKVETSKPKLPKTPDPGTPK